MTVRFLKNYKKLLFAILLIPLLSNTWMEPSFNIAIAYTTPYYYYYSGKPLPKEAKECLYKVYEDRDLIDSLRYMVDKRFFYAPGALGICFGKLIVFNFDPFDGFAYIFFGRSLLIHEVMHSTQMKRDTKFLFLIGLIYQMLDTGSYLETPLEKEAIKAEDNEVLCD